MDESAATVSVAGSQETVMVGAIGSYSDLGSVSEWTLEPRGENESEGDVVDIEIDSGAEVSCLPSNIGGDTYPLHETRLSMCGGHHVAAGGGKLHELGARILGLETDDVRDNMVNLLVRFRVMEIGKALLSTQDLSRCGWETVFPAGCGDAHLIRKASYDYATCNLSSLPNVELWSVVWTTLNSVPCFLVFPRSRLERQFVTFLSFWSRHVSLMIPRNLMFCYL